jgi:hypothetical protein
MKSKIYGSILLLFCTINNSFTQCDSIKILKNGWTISSFSSQETTGEGVNNGRAIHAIDSDSTTFWSSQWQSSQANYPHDIIINLGALYPVNGFSILSRHNNSNGKVKDFDLYLSQDGVNWGNSESTGTLKYSDSLGISKRGEIFFGAVDAQYVKIVMNSNYNNTPIINVSEIDIFQYSGTGCLSTGQHNQSISISKISKKETNSSNFSVVAAINTSLPLTYSILSGPATINGNTISLTGNAGTVVVKVNQIGNSNYYPSSNTTTFEVIDLSDYYPTVSTKLTDQKKLQMPTLKPYLLYANAQIPEPNFLTIQSVDFEINGVTIPTIYKDNCYQTWWTPSNYGFNTVYVKATGSNGNKDIDTLNIFVTDTITDLNVKTFFNGVIDFSSIGSQWYYGNYKLPQSVGAYDSIIANFSISCPSVTGGCDDWDRLGYVEFKAPNGDWMELFRYITPYGKPCHQSIDVTDYASLLQGNIELRMYIETWGSGGWKLNLDFDYKAGNPTYLYSTLNEVWHGNYNFGDPSNTQPVEMYEASFSNHIQASRLRLVTTGHGWGDNNTDNAAEFYHAIHSIQVNNQNTYQQDLWQNCNPNPGNCSNQYGSWQYDRAGWCPGSMGKVYSYDLTPLINQSFVNLNYKLQEDYVDLCHANNPNCISGVTCTDCNDGYNPYYHVGAYIINSSNEPIMAKLNNKVSEEFEFTIFPNPTNGQFYINSKSTIENFSISILDVTGDLKKVYFFKTNGELNQYQFDLTSLSKGIYFIKIQSKNTISSKKIILE